MLQKEKVIIPLSKCLPGMILLQPIVDEKTGTILLPRGSKLTQDNIQRMQYFQHTDLWVDLNTGDKIWEPEEKTLKAYKSYTKVLRHIIGEHNQKESQLNIEELKELVNYIIEDFKKAVTYQMGTDSYSFFNVTSFSLGWLKALLIL